MMSRFLHFEAQKFHLKNDLHDFYYCDRHYVPLVSTGNTNQLDPPIN